MDSELEIVAEYIQNITIRIIGPFHGEIWTCEGSAAGSIEILTRDLRTYLQLLYQVEVPVRCYNQVGLPYDPNHPLLDIPVTNGQRIIHLRV